MAKRKPKYTSKQICDAVDYYVTHGNHLLGTASVLGYLNKIGLSEWVKKAYIHQSTSLQICCQSDSKLILCSLEQRQVAVEAWFDVKPDYRVAI